MSWQTEVLVESDRVCVIQHFRWVDETLYRLVVIERERRHPAHYVQLRLEKIMPEDRWSICLHTEALHPVVAQSLAQYILEAPINPEAGVIEYLL